MVKNFSKKVAIPLGIGLFWSAMLYWRTGGLSAFTTYSYTLFRSGPVPRLAPEIIFQAHDGPRQSLAEYRGKYLLIEFMYLHCSTVCGIQRAKLYEYYPVLTKKNNINFISLSFDPQRDDLQTIYSSWQSLGSPKKWVFGSLSGNEEWIKKKLREFGVAVYQNRETLDFNHSAYFFLLSPEGSIVKVIDPSRPAVENIALINNMMEKIQ